MAYQPKPTTSEFEEKVIEISRVSKKTKGGNKIHFTALVVVGNKKGKVGAAIGKAPDVLSAIKKGIRKANRQAMTVNLHGRTIPHRVQIKRGAVKIFLKPAPKGSGVIAGGPIRTVMEVAGVRDVVSKILGSNNKAGNVFAAIEALQQLKPKT